MHLVEDLYGYWQSSIILQPGKGLDVKNSGSVNEVNSVVHRDILNELDRLSAVENGHIVKERIPKISLIGCGEVGSNVINKLVEKGVEGVELIAVNADKMHLRNIKAHKKVLWRTGNAAAMNTSDLPPSLDEATNETKNELASSIGKVELAFVIAGMGGRIGTSAAPIIAKMAKDQEALVIGVVTLPFLSEGESRMRNALYGIDKLKSVTDTTVVIANDRILEIMPKIPINDTFKVADKILLRVIEELAQIITKTGLVDLGYEDLKLIIKNGGIGTVGVGMSYNSREARAVTAVKHAVSSLMLPTDISTAKKALIKVYGDQTMTVQEAEAAIKVIQQSINPRSRIVWTFSVSPLLSEIAEAFVLLIGLESPTLSRPSRSNDYGNMVNSDDLLNDQKATLLVFSTIPDKYRKSRIFVEKFLFLLAKTLPEKLEYFDSNFEPYKFGPYNEYADEVVDSLRDFGLIDEFNDLTPQGEAIAEEIRGEEEIKPIVSALNELSNSTKNLDIDDIVYLTYNLYPDFTDKSIIKNKVRSNKLQAFKIDLKQLSENKEIVLHSDKGGSVRLKKIGTRLELEGD